MDRLVAGDRTPGTPKRAKMLTRVDRAMLLFQYAIEVRHRTALATFVQRPFTLELSDRGRISGVTVGVDPGSRVILPAQRSGEETLCCGRILLGPRGESRGSRRWSPLEVAPLAFDRYVGFGANYRSSA